MEDNSGRRGSGGGDRRGDGSREGGGGREGSGGREDRARILITGVDGNFGRKAAQTIVELVEPERLIFTSPTGRGLEEFARLGVTTRVANFNHSEGLVEAFAGAETLLLISVPFVGARRRQAHRNAIDAAVAAQVKRVVYTSIVGALSAECTAYEIADHKDTEAYLQKQPLFATVLYNSQYTEAMVAAFEEAYETGGGVLRNNMGEGKMAYVSRDDCAIAAAWAATERDPGNRSYDINGPEAMTIARFCEIGSEVTGKQVIYEAVTDEENYAFLDALGVPRTTEDMWAETAANFPFCSDGMVSFGRAIRLGQMSRAFGGFEELTGRAPLSVREVFEDIDHHRIGARNSTDD
ncbi:MAG: NmrA family NAD(P)-binding protein [Coriobacteriales bacterium]|jgi:NAD(P)H dehydrogenase (quinone)|nr:NmrA family NAD(P)-binding protein [Coriobacteriales bacterium]